VLIRFIAFIAIASTLLVACGGDEPSQPATEPSEAPAEQPQTPVQQSTASDLPEASRSQELEEAGTEQSQQAAAQPKEEQVSAEATLDSQKEQTASLPARPGGPPEPQFEMETARKYIEHLAVNLGPRASGTEQERAAAAYLADTFRSLGYEVEVQEFSFIAQEGISRIDTPDGYSARAFRFAGAAANAVTGKLLNVPGIGAPEDFASVDVGGNIAIVDRGVIEFRDKAANAEAAGAIGLIVANRTLGQSLGGTLGTDTPSIPVLHVSKEASDELRTRLGMTGSIPEATPERGNSQNVIARKPGGVCRVVTGGHYDTVPEVDGANDNASGTALTLALAETWTDHPGAVDACFIGFGAEELGLHGSAAYVRQLLNDGDRSEVTAMLNLDAIGDGRAPYRIIASRELQDLGNSVASDLGIYAGGGALPMSLGSDHASFSQMGIPVVFVFPPGAILHTPLDNLENVDFDLYEDISLLNHGILACLLERAGSRISPTISCGIE
jgi:aminopeptidase YwaD